MKPKGKGPFSGNGGQAVVEFALVLPVFLMLVLGAVEFGRAYYVLHILNNAARDGCRAAILPGSTDADVEARVTEFLAACNIEPKVGSPTVTVTDPGGSPRAGLSDAQQGDSVQVTVLHDFTIVTGSIIPGFQGTRELSSSCVFRHE